MHVYLGLTKQTKTFVYGRYVLFKRVFVFILLFLYFLGIFPFHFVRTCIYTSLWTVFLLALKRNSTLHKVLL